MSKFNPEFVTVQEAVKRGYGSRAALMKWVKANAVRNYLDDETRRRMVCAEDCEARVDARRLREPAPMTEDEILDRLAKSIASKAPALSAEGRAKLAELLR
ncbi:hypothetical protein [Thermophilibacter provencensis]|uniref:Transposase n=1 Tax=Thermophilibacter provencensis TaxID=1852386 RepID=A0ABT7V168_9ACTN|nr:hypothetical protein [Thermophilibacter provencensis]MDM8270360.1 hypothetical protein [Thermophilibacter provencensis]